MSDILVFAPEADSHATPISSALARLGHRVQRFALDKFPSADSHVVSFSDSEPPSLRSSATLGDLGGRFDTVWYRRPVAPPMDRFSGEGDDDVFIRGTLTSYWLSLSSCFASVFPATRFAFWVNDISGAYLAESKLLQLARAREAGLVIPPTIVTNDPETVTRFSRSQPRTLCKALIMNGGWHEETGQVYGEYSALLPEGKELPADSIRIVPAIYQRYIDKQYEIRTVFMGNRHFSLRIDSQAKESSSIDWRRGRPPPCVPYEIPRDLADRCRHFMRLLSIRFGCFDFIRRPDGEYVFLEVNQSGQFLFMEALCPELKLLDAFCQLLIHHDLDGWTAGDASFGLHEAYEWPEVSSVMVAARTAALEAAQRTGKKKIRLY